jgi:hypothetical protein
MKQWPAIIVACTLCACGTTTPPDDDDPEMPMPCEPGPTDDFVLGTIIPENPRWFRKFDEGCLTLEVQSGLQGGFHVAPAVQAPIDASVSDLGGELRWEVRDADDDVITNEARFEMFRNFWQEFEGGYAYGGDFVIFTRYPEDAVDTDVTVELTLDFDEESTLDDVTLTQTVHLVDEES